MTWEQHGPVRKGSGDQTTNTNNLVRIDQDSTQFSGTDCGGGDDDDDGDDGDDEGTTTTTTTKARASPSSAATRPRS